MVKNGVTTNLSITRDGKPGVDGAAGTTTTRIVYEKPDGTTEEVATLMMAFDSKVTWSYF